VSQFNSKEEYEDYIKTISTLPKGFSVAVNKISFFPREKEIPLPLPMNLSLILLNEPTRDFAGVFTKNMFPGHPIIHGRGLLNNEQVQGVLINNKISNVRCPGGLEDIDEILERFSREFSIPKEFIFSSSTGIIGWKLPVKDICESLTDLKQKQQNDTIFPVSKGIMTTDNFPKVRRVDIGQGSIVAIAKGAGMIEPNMATMLLFVLTDIKIERDDLRVIFPEVIAKTFNRISIDSDQSTSDTGLIFSSSLVEGIPFG
jgi:glutamate N-acetyltransferase / amino-acid N-acetyltransferase